MKYDFYITGTIGVAFDYWLGQKGTTADQVKAFLDAHQDQELNIAVSSLGGYIDEGITIGEYIKAHGKCNMTIIGMTASAATVLCMKAKSIKIAKGSMMLIHNSSMVLDVWTSANKQKIDEIIESFRKQREDLDTIDKAIAQIYSFRNGKSIEENMKKMDEEKWMLAEDALDFGIVDEIITDDMSQAKAKAVKNAYATNTDLPGHFGVPAIPTDDNGKMQSPGFIARLRSLGRDILNIVSSAEEEEENHTNICVNMKKLILNNACALLSIEAFQLNEKGEAVLTEEQLGKIENGLKEKDDTIQNLQDEKKTAEAATAKDEKERDDAIADKQTAEKALADLQKEYDDFKKQAGDDSPTHTLDGDKDPVTAKSMLNEVSNLL